MKFFSRQLLVKHMFMRQCEGEGCREAERQIDALIEPNHFLNIADLQPRSMQVSAIWWCVCVCAELAGNVSCGALLTQCWPPSVLFPLVSLSIFILPLPLPLSPSLSLPLTATERRAAVSR